MHRRLSAGAEARTAVRGRVLQVVAMFVFGPRWRTHIEIVKLTAADRLRVVVLCGLSADRVGPPHLVVVTSHEFLARPQRGFAGRRG